MTGMSYFTKLCRKLHDRQAEWEERTWRRPRKGRLEYCSGCIYRRATASPLIQPRRLSSFVEFAIQ